MIIKKIYDYSLSLLHFPNLQKKEHFDLSPQKKKVFLPSTKTIFYWCFLIQQFQATPEQFRPVICSRFFTDFSPTFHTLGICRAMKD